MNLKTFYHKEVEIIDTMGRLFEGKVSDYVFPDDNENGLESIIIDCSKGKLAGHPVEFWEKDITSIKTII